MKKHSRILVASAMLGTTAVLSCVAATASATELTGRDITVRYADLDAGSVDGATLLLKRIEAASGRVCASLDHGDLASRSRREACEGKLIAAAVTHVNSPVLADVYRSVRRESPRVIAQAR
jgi:UrcA family protein